MVFDPPTKPPAPPPRPKLFVPQQEVKRALETPALTAPPVVETAANLPQVAFLQPQIVPPKLQPRPFTPPDSKRTPAPAPALAAPPQVAMNGNMTMAVVGLKPADRPPPPLPDAARDAQFSSAPQPRAPGGKAA